MLETSWQLLILVEDSSILEAPICITHNAEKLGLKLLWAIRTKELNTLHLGSPYYEMNQVTIIKQKALLNRFVPFGFR